MRQHAGEWIGAALLSIVLGSSAFAFEVFHSPLDNGVSGGVASLGAGPNALNLWISNGTTPTSSGSVCVNGNGQEICGWDIRVSCQGCTFASFDAQGADVVSNIEANQLTFHANGGNPLAPTAGAERAGVLTVNVSGPGQVQLIGDQWVSAALVGANVAVAPIAVAADGDSDGALDADDNCPGIANAGQGDAGTLGSLTPDGIGDFCQCGDVTANGAVTATDALRINQALLNLTPVTGTNGATQSQTTGTLWLRGRCNVSSPTVDLCNATDSLRISQALVGVHPNPAQVAAKFEGFCPGEALP
jgi:hypothetical protein